MIDPLEIHLQQIRDSLRAVLTAHRSHCGYTGWPADLERLLDGPLPAAEQAAKRLLEQIPSNSPIVKP